MDSRTSFGQERREKGAFFSRYGRARSLRVVGRFESRRFESWRLCRGVWSGLNLQVSQVLKTVQKLSGLAFTLI